MEPPRRNDGRASSRLHAPLPVRYGDGSSVHGALARNISRSGLHILTNEVLRVGTRIQLVIEFPERNFQLTGEVMWAIKVPDHQRQTLVHGMGVEFVDPGDEWKTFFDAWKARSAATTPA